MCLFDIFEIHRRERELAELQIDSLKVYVEQAEVEKALIENEQPEVRRFLASEFELHRAMNMMADRYADKGLYLPYKPPKTADTIKFARLMARTATNVKEKV